MQAFLDNVLDEEQPHGYQSSIFILPSRRSSQVLSSKLATRSTQTAFAPLIFSIEEFIAHITGLTSSDTISLTFTLYESYKEIVNEDKQVNFQTFCTWSQPILGDFNEIDRFLLNQKELFNHLTALKEIDGHWTTSSSKLVLNYINFWNQLGPIYTLFCSKCIDRGAVHQGLIYRQAVDGIEHYLRSTNDLRHLFIGFNALNTAEQQLIQAILEAGNSEIYWDTERVFNINDYHETSLFTKSYKKRWNYFKSNTFKWSFNNYTQKKDITVFSTSQNIQQAKAIGTILLQKEETDLSKTAIILGDEALLIPILNSIPDHINNINITMGIPLSDTPSASLFDQIFTLKKNDRTNGYYYKDVLTLLRNALVQQLLGSTSQLIEHYIIKNNIIFTSLDQLKNISKSTHTQKSLSLLFEPWEQSVTVALTNFSHIIEALKELFKDESQFLQLEYLFGFYKAFNKLKQLIDSQNYIKDIPTLFYFYREVISSETIDLRGDPKQGLQIMGVLESRVLDYEHIIITSVNEGILPSGKSQNSYIPYDLKKYYSLPTYAEKDAIYAYHFYHLLHRAKKVDLLYTTNNDGLGSTEKSRFIRQLELEDIHDIKNITISPSSTKTKNKEILIEKTTAVIEQLRALFKKGISPSALTTYLRSPIVFYERYVLRVRDEDQVEETVAANTMGTIVHDTLEALYTPLIGKKITAKDLNSLLPNIKAEVKTQFKESYGLTHIHQGKNSIIFAVICRYISNYIKQETSLIKEGDEVEIIALEEDLKDIPLQSDVLLRGKVDLVEKRNGKLRIIDYKTGKVIGGDLKLSEWQDLLLPEGAYEKAFQVLMYAYMMHASKKIDFPVQVGVISFKNLQAGFLPFSFNKNQEVTLETLLAFESVLKSLIAEILNPAIPFREREV